MQKFRNYDDDDDGKQEKEQENNPMCADLLVH